MKKQPFKSLFPILFLLMLTGNIYGQQHMFTITKFRGGTVTATSPGGGVLSGSMVDDGTQITLTVIPDAGRSLEKLYVNGTDVYPQYQPAGSYTFPINSETTVMAVYDPQVCILTYSYQGAGYVEVWSDQTNADPPAPAGEQYGMGALLPYGSIIHVFPFKYDGSELQSIKVNGDEYADDQKFILTGNVQALVDGDIDVVAVFSGISNGVEQLPLSNAAVYGVSGGIAVKSNEKTSADVFAANGTLVSSQEVDVESVIKVLPGIYTVVINGASYKVSVK